MAYLPQYDPRMQVVPDDDAATFAMSVEALKAIQRSSRAVEQAHHPGAEPRQVLVPERARNHV